MIQSIPMDGNTSKPTLIWEAAESDFFPINGLAFDPKDQVLFWSYLNCSYKYQAEDKLPQSVFCDSNHLFGRSNASAPSLLAYFNQHLLILIAGQSDVSYVNEDRITNIAFLFGPQNNMNGPIGTSVQDLLIVDSSLQPGGCGPVHILVQVLHQYGSQCHASGHG